MRSSEVDDDDDPPSQGPRVAGNARTDDARNGTSWVESFNNILPDADAVFAYDTVKLVNVLDRRLGVVYYLVQFMIACYILIVVVLLNRDYLVKEVTAGWVLCNVMQPQMSSAGFSWDVYDRITAPGEQGAVFIPTRVLVTHQSQQEGQYCKSPVHNCTDDEDCGSSDVLGQHRECVDGFCMRFQWCPAEDPDAITTETHYLDISKVELWLQSYVHYNEFEMDVSTMNEKEIVYYPHKNANTYKLNDLLRMASLSLEDLQDYGAIIYVNNIFDCDVDRDTCTRNVEAFNIDTRTGFNHVVSYLYEDGGIKKRDTYRMYGIRMMTFSRGLGARTSFSQVILQLSSAIALLVVAENVADFYLQYIVPERHQYRQLKVIQTEDFNDD